MHNIIHFVRFIKLTFKLKLFLRKFLFWSTRNLLKLRKSKRPPKLKGLKLKELTIFIRPGELVIRRQTLYYLSETLQYLENQHFLKSGINIF